MLNREYTLADHGPLHDAIALDLMSPNPRSIDQSTTIREAAEFFCLAGVSGAPVIDDAGRPVGVLSRSDVLRHLMRSTSASANVSGRTSEIGDKSELPVRRIMTRTVFSVRPETPAAKVIAKLTALQVSRLFVVDRYGVLIGVISVYDLLHRLAVSEPWQANGMAHQRRSSAAVLAS
jgi:CBS domain-containing protein